MLEQAEREEHQQIIDEKQSRALLKNALDPLLSQLTKVCGADTITKTEIDLKSKGQRNR